jgi:hypothetical protein
MSANIVVLIERSIVFASFNCVVGAPREMKTRRCLKAKDDDNGLMGAGEIAVF